MNSNMSYHRNERAAQLPARLSRSWLLTNASDASLYGPASESEADSVILDIEDACPAEEKPAARKRVVEALNDGMKAWVRINDIHTEFWEDDLAALSEAKGLRGIVLAKTEHPDHVTRTAMMARAGTPIIALIESALGIVNAVDIARAPGTFRLAFGLGDYRKDTGVSNDAMALAYARSALVVASRVGELPGPIDGPANGVDEAGLREACAVTASMGMTGKLTLQPGQAEGINSALAPSEEEIRWAREMLQKSEGGEVPKDGSYLPRLARARKVSELAQTYGMWGN
jgi:citrate lyase subunit beta/citryl-CoA lyase